MSVGRSVGGLEESICRQFSLAIVSRHLLLSAARSVSVRYTAQIFHRIEHEYHGHRIGVIAARLCRGCPASAVAAVARAVAVHDVRVLFQARAALGQLDDAARAHPGVVAQYLHTNGKRKTTTMSVRTNDENTLNSMLRFSNVLQSHSRRVLYAHRTVKLCTQFGNRTRVTRACVCTYHAITFGAF